MSCQLDEKPPAMLPAVTVSTTTRQGAAESCSNASTPPASAAAAGNGSGIIVKDEPRVPPTFTKDMSNYRDSTKKPSAAAGAEQPYDRPLLMPLLGATGAASSSAFGGSGSRSGTTRHAAAAAAAAAAVAAAASARNDDDEDDEAGGCGSNSDRLRNDLLDEICNDMGIHDSMDLDFYDFPSGSGAPSPAPYDDRLLAASSSSSRAPCRTVSAAAAAATVPAAAAAQAVHVKREGSDCGAAAAAAAAVSGSRPAMAEGGGGSGRGFVGDDQQAGPGGVAAATPTTAISTAATAQSMALAGSEQRQPMDCAERSGGSSAAAQSAIMMQYNAAAAAAAFQQQQSLDEGHAAGKESPAVGGNGGGAGSNGHHHHHHHRSGSSSSSASPDLLSGLRQGLGSATDDSKFSMAQQHSSKAAPQRQQSRNDYSPYQVPSKQQQQLAQPPPPSSAASGYYQGPGELAAAGPPGAGGFGMRRSGSTMMVDAGAGSLADQSWFDGGAGARWTSFPTVPAAASAAAASAAGHAVNGHHFDDGSSSSAPAHDYPEDFCMEDLTAPDSTINFSELPQQPNYYQVPEFTGLAQNGQLNISFNMSLSSGGQPAVSAQQVVAPPLYHLPSAAPPVARPAAAASAAAAHGPQYLKRQVSAPVIHSAGLSGGQSGGHHNHHQMAAQLMSGASNAMYAAGMATGQAPSVQNGRFPVSAGSAPALPAMGYRAAAAYQSSGASAVSGNLLAQATTASAVNPASAGFCSSAAMAAVTAAGSDQQQQQALIGAAMAASSSSIQASPVHQQLPSAPGKSPLVAPNTHDFMQRLVMDKSSAFRSHPLFPLLRDLIIADMNFHEPSFPHQLIRDLPADFGKLLKNYLTRNPPRGTYQSNHSVESVVMDALRFAHHSLIDKIQQKRAAAAAAAAESQARRAPADGGGAGAMPPFCAAGSGGATSSGGGMTLQQQQLQLQAECGGGVTSSSSLAAGALVGHGTQSELDGSLKHGFEQAPDDGGLSSERGHVVGPTSSDSIMAVVSAHMASPNYRQPLTVDTSCGLGAQSPMTTGSQSSCYAAAGGRQMPPNGAPPSRQFATAPRPSMQQPGAGYAMQQQHPHAAASGYQQSFGSLMGGGASDGSAGQRDPSCYYYGGGGAGGPGAAAASSADGFAQSYQSPEQMTPLGSGMMQQQPLMHRQHQQGAMSGLQYGGGGGSSGGPAGVCSPLYPQAYSHMQNGTQMNERQHDMGQLYGGGGDASYLMKPILEPGKMSRGYLGGPSAAASAHCLDYVRTGGSMGRGSGSMSDLLGGMPSAACLGGHHHLGGHMQPGKLGVLPQQQQQQTSGMGGGPGGSGGAEGATRKHQSLPKEAVSVMLSWLKEHQDKPYPNDDEKSALIKQTGLSITQINYWFTNARRRLLPKWRGEDM